MLYEVLSERCGDGLPVKEISLGIDIRKTQTELYCNMTDNQRAPVKNEVEAPQPNKAYINHKQMLGVKAQVNLRKQVERHAPQMSKEEMIYAKALVLDIKFAEQTHPNKMDMCYEDDDGVNNYQLQVRTMHRIHDSHPRTREEVCEVLVERKWRIEDIIAVMPSIRPISFRMDYDEDDVPFMKDMLYSVETVEYVLSVAYRDDVQPLEEIPDLQRLLTVFDCGALEHYDESKRTCALRILDNASMVQEYRTKEKKQKRLDSIKMKRADEEVVFLTALRQHREWCEVQDLMDDWKKAPKNWEPKQRLKFERDLQEECRRNEVWLMRNKVYSRLLYSHLTAEQNEHDDMLEIIFQSFEKDYGAKKHARKVEPRYKLEDLLSRLARLGFVGFRAKVTCMWNQTNGSSKAKYIIICNEYDVDYFGRTENIHSVQYLLNKCEDKEFSRMILDKIRKKQLIGFTEKQLRNIKTRLGVRHQGAGPSKSLAERTKERSYEYENRIMKGEIALTLSMLFENFMNTVRETVDSYTGGGYLFPSFSLQDTLLLTALLTTNEASTRSLLMVSFTQSEMFSWMFSTLRMDAAMLTVMSACWDAGDRAAFFRESPDPVPANRGELDTESIDGMKLHAYNEGVAGDLNPYIGWDFGSRIDIQFVVNREYERGRNQQSERVVHQAGEEGEFDFVKNMERVRQAPVVTKTIGFFSYMIGTKVFDASGAKKFFGTTIEALSMSLESGDTFMALTQLVDYWIKRCKIVATSGDWRDFFEKDKTAAAIESMSAVIETMKGKSTVGDPRVLTDKANILIARYAKDTNVHVVRKWQELAGALEEFKSGFCTTRKPPLGMIFTGPPGMGKTHAISFIAMVYKKTHDIPEDIEITHFLNKTKHQVLPTCVHLLVDNDTFSTKDELQVAISGQTYVDRFQSYVDTDILRLECASLSQKANSAIEPSFVIGTTNTSSLPISTMVSGVNKLDRRYWIVQFRLKVFYLDRFDSDEEAYRHFSRNYEPGAVEYVTGYMKNAFNATEIRFVPVEGIEIFSSLDQLCAKIFPRLDNLVRPNVKQIGCFGCGLRGYCVCKVAQGSSFSIPVDLKLSPDMKKDVEKITLDVKDLGLKFLKGIAAIGAVLISFQFLLNVAVPYIRRQSSTVSHVVNLPKKDDVVVEPFTDRKVPWMGKSVLTNRVIIKRADGSFIGATVILENIIVTNDHFVTGVEPTWQALHEEEVLEIIYGGITYKHVFRKKTTYTVPGEDLVFFYVGMLRSVYDPAYRHLPEHKSVPKKTSSLLGKEVTDVLFNGKYLTFKASWTQYGDCGNSLYDSDGFIYGIFCGFYPSNDLRLAVPISKQIADLAIDHFKGLGLHAIEMSTELPIAYQHFTKRKDFVEGVAHPQGCAAKLEAFEGVTLTSLAHLPLGHVSTPDRMKCKVEVTPLKAVFPECPDYSAPFSGKSVLVDGVWKGPVLKRLRAMGKTGSLDIVHTENVLKAMLGDYTYFPKVTPIDLYRSICGDEMNVLINSRDNNKSLGTTARMVFGLTNEQAFKEVGPNEFEVHAKIIEHAEMYLGNFLSDEPLMIPFVKACKKGELKLTEKAKKGDCRLFYCSDVAYNLAMRCLLLPILTYLMKNMYESGVFATINAGSSQWAEIEKFLSAFGPKKLFAGDFEGMDISHEWFQEIVAKHYQEIALKMGYTQKQAQGVYRCVRSSMTYVLLMMGDLFLCTKGLNSGVPDTLVRNSLIAKALVYYILSILGIIKDGKIEGKRCVESVHMANTGDDNNIHFKKMEWETPHGVIIITGPLIIEMMKRLGYIYTSADKESVLITQSVDEITYLKRRFVKNDFGVMACLDMKSILKSICYRVDCKLGDERIRDRAAVLSAAREMFLYGEKPYEDFCWKVKTVFEVEFPSYSSLKRDYLMGMFNTWENRTIECKRIDDVKLITTCAVGEISHQSNTAGHAAKEGALDGKLLSHLTIAELNYTQNIEVAPKDEVTHITDIVLEKVSFKSGLLGMRDIPNEVSLQEYWARPRQVFALLTTSGANIFGGFVTWKGLAPVNSVIKYWSLFRGDAHLKVLVSGGSQFMGLWRVYAYPVRDIRSTYDYNLAPTALLDPAASQYNFCWTSQLPHLDFDLSTAGTYELVLPFPHPREYMTLAQSDWVFRIVPLNGPLLANGLSPTPLNLQFMLSYHNVKLDRVVPQSKEMPSRALSRGMSYTSSLLKDLPFSWASPLSKVISAGSDVAHWAGFARPPVESEDTCVMRFNENPALTSGQPDFSMTLASNPAVFRNVDDVAPLVEKGETEFRNMFNRKAMYCLNLQAGTVINVRPDCLINNYQADITPALYATPLAFATMPFFWWTGNLTVCVQIISSPLVRWRIGVVIVPPDVAVPATFPTDGTYLTSIIESTGSTCSDVDIPYLYSDPFTAVSSGFTTGTPNAASTRLVYFSLMVPTGPAATPVYPFVNLWINAGDKYSVGVPTTNTIDQFKIVNQSFTPTTGTQACAVFGEGFGNFEELAKRRSAYMKFKPTNELYNGYFALPVFPSTPVDSPGIALYTIDSMSWTFMTWFSIAFMGTTGSVVHKLQPTLNELAQYLTVGNSFVPLGSSRPQLQGLIEYYPTGTGANVWAIRNNPFAEARVPDRNPYMFRLTTSTLPILGGIAAECVIGEPSVNTDRDWWAWAGAGDDFRFQGFLGIPPMYRRADA